MLAIIYLVVIICLVVQCLLARNSAMAIMAYLVKHGYPMPSDEELKELCRQAWKHMFTRE